MTCCPQCVAADKKFGRKTAERDRRRYQRHGPDGTTRGIIAAVRSLGLQDATLLDVGGGIGVIQHELLGEEVAHAVLVEAASAYVAVAREETEARGNGVKTQFFVGDFASIAEHVPDADLVTLDRVVCCYPDYNRLLTVSAARCRKALALSYPRNRWAVRLVIAAENFGRQLVRDPFRTFVHPPEEMDRVLTTAGLTLAKTKQSLAWRVALYTRSAVLK